MLIKSVKLNNIRSYLSQGIEFPAGSTLLAGDVGSGKSSILLAIEFALFGIKRKHLSGSSLLRHGKKEGSVELNFEIGGKDIIVKRYLKRGRDDIKQEAGYIVIDNRKTEGTAVELKSRILDLLGYPKELLAKSEDLVYRYTIYTPQEEMKQILTEDEEIRLNTLRRVFGIDKYKRVRENSQIIAKELKEKMAGMAAKTEDLEEKKRQKKEREHDTKEIDIRLEELMPKIKAIKTELKKKKEEIRVYEKDVEKLNALKSELSVLDAHLRNRLEQRETNKEEALRLEKEISVLEKEIGDKKDIRIEALLGDVKDRENAISFMEATIKEIAKKLNEFDVKKRYSNSIKEKISKMEKCPTCEQDVGEEYKKNILKREGKNIAELEDSIKMHQGQEKAANLKLEELKKELKELKEKERALSIIKIRLENLKEKAAHRSKLEEMQEKLKKDIGSINSKKIMLNEEIKKYLEAEKNLLKEKEMLDEISGKERKLEIDEAALKKEKEGIAKLTAVLESEIKEKEESKKSLAYIKELQNWLEQYFINLMGVMERNVMLKIYHEFNELFQQWFNILVEDETINARLDDSFTPVIEQNGYETMIENLSGGEKTSLALAYRLALNKVINDIISTIKTKDIIILDEPTDGFSSEQLDKIRVVLEQLSIKQVILVSHENKIESFVDNVIEINKKEHVSSVV